MGRSTPVATTVWAAGLALCAVISSVAHPPRAFAAPSLQMVRFIQTTPFINSTVEMGDGEGMTFVPVDNRLWLGDDSENRIYEVDKDSGHLLSTIGASQLATALDFATRRTAAGTSRAGDIEGVAYDPWQDLLYVFSGNCCPEPPAVFRLVRGSNGQFQVETYQPLPSSSNFTGAAFHPIERILYVSDGGDIKPYDYVTNTRGAAVPINGVDGTIYGMGFSPDGNDLWVVSSSDKVYRIAWATTGTTKSVVPGYVFDMVAQGIQDGRAVDFINGQLYVLDGHDSVSNSNPRRFAVAVFDILDTAVSPPAAPTDLVATATASTEITLTWTDHATNEDGFMLERCLDAGCATIGRVVAVDANVTGYVDTGLTPSTSYWYRVRARNAGANSAYSNTATATTLAGDTPVVEVRVAAGADDAEETAAGSVGLTSSDLELVVDGSKQQTVGLRFTGVSIPAGATIQTAYVQFKVDETSTEATSLTIQGEASDNAGPFLRTMGNVSTRPRTGAAVAWAPVAWTMVGVAGPDQRTPDLRAVVQEIVDQAGWASGHALVLVLTGTGRRVADSYDGDPGGAPLLHVEYTQGPPANQAPNGVIDTPTGPVTIAPGESVSFSGTGTDPEGDALTFSWSFPGGTPSSSPAEDPGAVTFNTPGTYTVTLTVTDSLGLADPTPASRVVTVNAPAPAPTQLLTNGGFEEGEAGWTNWSSSSRFVTTLSPFAGAFALQVNAGASNRYIHQTIPVTAGGTYTVSMALRTALTTSVGKGKIEWLTSTGSVIKSLYFGDTTGTTPWTVYTTTQTAPSGAVQVRIYCWVTNGGTGSAWFDAVEVR